MGSGGSLRGLSSDGLPFPTEGGSKVAARDEERGEEVMGGLQREEKVLTGF